MGASNPAKVLGSKIYLFSSPSDAEALDEFNGTIIFKIRQKWGDIGGGRSQNLDPLQYAIGINTVAKSAT